MFKGVTATDLRQVHVYSVPVKADGTFDEQNPTELEIGEDVQVTVDPTNGSISVSGFDYVARAVKAQIILQHFTQSGRIPVSSPIS